MSANARRASATLLHQGYDAGNYDSAYVSENFTKAWRKREGRAKSAAYRAAYILGFFSSYETHEVPYNYQEEVVAAEHRYGNEMRAAGIGVDSRAAVDF